MSGVELQTNILDSRSPHGERGLKFAMSETNPDGGGSLSSWRAWIEIGSARRRNVISRVALLMESVD